MGYDIGLPQKAFK